MENKKNNRLDKKNLKIGMVGVGWIGGNYSDVFEEMGYTVIRYDLSTYKENKEKIKDCDIVFVAVPTPSTPDGFDDSILIDAIKNTKEEQTIVIKSTIKVGTTEKLQKIFSDRFIFHSPEFLTECTAKRDAQNPNRNIIGIVSEEQKEKAQEVLDILPKASFELICNSRDAEMIKYAGNNWFYFKVLYVNLLYDLVCKAGCNYDIVREGMAADSRVGKSHLIPVHDSGTIGGDAYDLQSENKEENKTEARGAGGHCFIKDFAAFIEMYKEMVGDKEGVNLLEAMETKNIKLLKDSNKDLDLLKGVYGEDIIK